MISHATGPVADGLYVCGLTWSPVYLLESAVPVLFEAGFSCAANLYEKDIQRVLQEREPGMLFITHGHWDHCGTAAFLKHRFAGLRIAASPDTGAILSRAGARKVMTRLGATVIPTLRSLLCEADATTLVDQPFQPFHLDMQLVDGQSIGVTAGLTVQVVATPGHTRDHLSFYIPERRMLFGGEAAGCLEPMGGITPEFLVDYDGYVRSLRRLKELPVDIYCLAHHYVLVGSDAVKKFLAKSLETTERFADRLYALLDEEGDDMDRVLRQLAAEYRVTNPGLQQPVEAYLLNLTAQLTHLYERRKKDRFSKSSHVGTIST